MPVFGPLQRIDFIKCMRKIGFEGPFSGGKHQFMIKGSKVIRIPNPHKKDIGKGLLSRILRQAGISREEWEKI